MSDNHIAISCHEVNITENISKIKEGILKKELKV